MVDAAPAVSRVLCATDLSDEGNCAVPWAFAIAAPGAEVTLLHVLRLPEVPSPLVPHYGKKHLSSEELEATRRALSERLAALAASPRARRELSCRTRIVEAADVAEAIAAEAERLEADAICMMTHCRSGLAEFVLGSTAQEVLQRAARPVLLVPLPASS